jgi:hypothetical protein
MQTQRHRLGILLTAATLLGGGLAGRASGAAAVHQGSGASTSHSGPTSVKITCAATSISVGQSTSCRAFYYPSEQYPGVEVTSSAQFSSANPGVVSMSGPTATGVAAGSTHVFATYNGSTGLVGITVSNPSTPPFNVYGLVGPSRIHPSDDYCEWSVSLGGGVAPYTYQWAGLAAGETGAQVMFQPASSGTIHVTVWDATGAAREASMYVEVTSNQLPGCF